MSSREYELIVLGATGYTGKYCAEYITTSLPTDLRWAVAGRTESKLAALVRELQSLNADRSPPSIEVANLSPEDLDHVAKKTRLIINTIGPYHLYSSPVVEACARNGTHYLDVTGETPWVLDMIEKYHDVAKANGAIIIPEIGFESAPSDVLTLSLVNLIRQELFLGTKEVVACVHAMKSRPSGGTVATILTVLDTYGAKGVTRAMKPWALSPVAGPKSRANQSWMTKIFGVRSVPDLGTLTTSFGASPNVAIVQRSWGLLDSGSGKQYGENFQYSEYMKIPSVFLGAAVHFAVLLAGILLAFPPLRWALKLLVPQPGDGPTKESTARDMVEYRAVATADQPTTQPKRAFGRLRWNGGIYHLTGVLLAEAAMVILQDNSTAQRLGGGLLTPATLGQPFVDRMQNAGLIVETKMLPD